MTDTPHPTCPTCGTPLEDSEAEGAVTHECPPGFRPTPEEALRLANRADLFARADHHDPYRALAEATHLVEQMESTIRALVAENERGCEIRGDGSCSIHRFANCNAAKLADEARRLQDEVQRLTEQVEWFRTYNTEARLLDKVRVGRIESEKDKFTIYEQDEFGDASGEVNSYAALVVFDTEEQRDAFAAILDVDTDTP